MFAAVLLRLSRWDRTWRPLLPDRWAASHPEHVLQHRLDESRRKAARQKEKAPAASHLPRDDSDFRTTTAREVRRLWRCRVRRNARAAAMTMRMVGPCAYARGDNVSCGRPAVACPSLPSAYVEGVSCTSFYAWNRRAGRSRSFPRAWSRPLFVSAPTRPPIRS